MSFVAGKENIAENLEKFSLKVGGGKTSFFL